MFLSWIGSALKDFPGWLAQPKNKSRRMLIPIYTTQCIKAAFHLRYTWTGWPTAGTSFPAEPGHQLFTQLDHAWQSDNIRRIAMNWSTSCSK